MDIILTIILIAFVICIFGLFLCQWALKCNNKTYRDRISMIDKITKSGDNYNVFDAVTFNQHFKYYFWMKDPFTLYPDNIDTFIICKTRYGNKTWDKFTVAEKTAARNFLEGKF